MNLDCTAALPRLALLSYCGCWSDCKAAGLGPGSMSTVTWLNLTWCRLEDLRKRRYLELARMILTEKICSLSYSLSLLKYCFCDHWGERSLFFWWCQVLAGFSQNSFNLHDMQTFICQHCRQNISFSDCFEKYVNGISWPSSTLFLWKYLNMVVELLCSFDPDRREGGWQVAIMGQIPTINDPGIDNTVQQRLLQKAQSKWFDIDTSSTSYLPQAPPISQTNGAMHLRRSLFRSIPPYIIGLVGFWALRYNMPSFLIFFQYNVDQTKLSGKEDPSEPIEDMSARWTVQKCTLKSSLRKKERWKS